MSGSSQTYLHKARVQYVMPTPQRVEAAAESIIYVFSLASTPEPVQITFVVEPQQPGRLHGRFALHNQISVQFAQFIYP